MILFKFGRISKEDQEYLFFLGWKIRVSIAVSPCGKYALTLREGILRYIG